LLYYQAGIERLRLQELDVLWRADQGGAPPGEVARQFLSRVECRAVIELLKTATDISACDWGLTPSGKWRVGGFSTSLQSLATWLSVDARIQAADRRYREAFETVLRLRRFGRHVGDEVYRMWAISETLDAKAFSLIQDVLAWMPPDANTVTWLELQLGREEGPSWRPRRALASWCDMEIESWRASPEVYEHWRTVYLREMMDPAAVAELKNLAVPELLERMRTAYSRFLDSAAVILEGDSSYQDTCTQIKQLIEGVHTEGKKGSAIAFMYSCVDPVDGYYTMHINAEARANAVKAALAVYHIKAETGLLPETLPGGLPSDPYSGENFDYQITEEGFTLGCRAMAFGYSQGLRQFDFKVREENKN